MLLRFNEGFRPFFTADQHFGHKNILQHQGRPFGSSHAMDEAMIERWNAIIGKKDHIFFLGDLALCAPARARAIVERLHGTKHWCLGNHDKPPMVKAVGSLFETVADRIEIVFPEKGAPKATRVIVLDHYSMRVWNMRHWGSWHLYGHNHCTLREDPLSLSMDVGVDGHDFSPWRSSTG